MGCYLRVWGKFDPDALRASLNVPIERIWKEGEPSRRGQVHEDSGMQMCASDADQEDYEKQLAEAEAFLRVHRDAIAAISTREDTLGSVLDFGIEKPASFVFFRGIPASLIAIAGELRLSIELSFYPISKEDKIDRSRLRPRGM